MNKVDEFCIYLDKVQEDYSEFKYFNDARDCKIYVNMDNLFAYIDYDFIKDAPYPKQVVERFIGLGLMVR
jgi:hypothetical protein